MRRNHFYFFFLMLFIFISISSLAGNNDSTDYADATVTTYFEDVAREILAMDSFDDLFSLDGFFDDDPGAELTPSQPIPPTPVSTVSHQDPAMPDRKSVV